MRARDSPQDGWFEAGAGCWFVNVVSAQRYGAEAAAQQADRGDHLRGKRERGKRVEDRKEGTTEGSEEQRALYTRAERRGGALPDRAGLNPRRQRTGSDSTYKVRESLCGTRTCCFRPRPRPANILNHWPQKQLGFHSTGQNGRENSSNRCLLRLKFAPPKNLSLKCSMDHRRWTYAIPISQP
jgi:hypothetical protein